MAYRGSHPGLKLEAFKFGLCFGIPFALVAAFSNADFYEYVMKKTQYLVFPPEQNRDLLQQHMMEHNLAAMERRREKEAGTDAAKSSA
eukprot:tig00021127_g18679.t1